MKSGLVVVLSALVCQILAQDWIRAVNDFDAEKFAGKWFLIAMVMDEVVTEDAVIFGSTAVAKGSGDVLLQVLIWKDDTCQSEEVRLIETQQPGVFAVTGAAGLETCPPASQHGVSFRNGCDTTVQMVEVDYDSYYILQFTPANNRILHLYTREKNPDDQQREIFRKAATSLGFDLNNMIDNRNVECAEPMVKK